MTLVVKGDEMWVLTLSDFWLNEFAPSLLDAATKGLVIVSVAGVITFGLRRQAAAWRHLVWTLAAVGLVVLPVFASVLPAWRVAAPEFLQPALASLQAKNVSRPPVIVETDGEEISGFEVDRAAALSDSSGQEIYSPEAAEETSALTPGQKFEGDVDAVAEIVSQSDGVTELAAFDSVVEETRRPSLMTVGRQWAFEHLPAVWLLGVLLSLLMPAVGMIQLRFLGRRSASVESDDWSRLLAELCRELTIRRRVRLLKSCRSKAPLTWGAFRPIVLLPKESADWLESRRRMVLLHELSHVKRLDWLTQVVAQLAAALHWFNPAAWYMVRRMQIEREQACDDMVLAAGATATDYADELMHFAMRSRASSCFVTAAVPMARKTSLEIRVRSILDGSLCRRSLTRVAVFTGVVFGCCVVVPISMINAFAEAGAALGEANVENDVAEAEPAGEAGTEPPSKPQKEPDSATGKQGRLQTGDAVELLPGKVYDVPGGATLTITRQVFHGSDVLTNAELNWLANGERPALRHRIYVASNAFANRDIWSAVWERGTTRLWLANSGPGGRIPNLRAIDFRDPAAVVTYVEYGDDKFDIGEPDDAGVAGNREHASIGVPLPRVPAQVMAVLLKKLPALKELGKGLHSFGGEHKDAAMTAAEWSIEGTVRDASGRPMKGVLVAAATEFRSTTQVIAKRTDANGRYKLRFPMDLTTLASFRGVIVKPELAGYFEEDFSRAGEFSMLLDKGETLKRRFSDRDAILGENAVANFVMKPATTIEGVVVGADEQPLAKADVSIRYYEQRKGYSLSRAATDEKGRFRLTNFPTNEPLMLTVTMSLEQSASLSCLAAEDGPQRLLKFQLIGRRDSARLVVIKSPPEDADGRDRLVKVRVVEGQKEVAPPKSSSQFADNVLAWVQSCRVDKSAPILEKNPNVWSQVMSSHSLVHVEFDPPRMTRLIGADGNGHRELAVTDVAFALYSGGPGGMFVKADDQVMCLDHWTLQTLMPVIREPALKADKVMGNWYARFLDATSPENPLPRDGAAVVRLTAENKLTFNGQIVGHNDLPARLTEAGFDKQSVIRLEFSPDADVSKLHRPLWRLRTSRWNNVRIDMPPVKPVD